MGQSLVIRYAERLSDNAHLVHDLRLQTIIVLRLTIAVHIYGYESLVHDAVVGPTGIDSSAERVENIHGKVFRQCLPSKKERRRREVVGEQGIGNREHGTIIKTNRALVTFLAMMPLADAHYVNS